MLRKALPPEVMELLAPEKIKEFGEKLNAFVMDIRQGQVDINERLDRIDERLENARCNYSSRKPAPRAIGGADT